MMRHLPKLAALSGSRVSGGQRWALSAVSSSDSSGLAAINAPQDGQYASINLRRQLGRDGIGLDKMGLLCAVLVQ